MKVVAFFALLSAGVISNTAYGSIHDKIGNIVPETQLRTLLEAFNAPAWLYNNIELILIGVGLLFAIMLFNSIWRAGKFAFSVGKGVYGGIRWCVFRIRGLRGRLNKNRKKPLHQETLSEAIKIAAKSERRSKHDQVKKAKIEKKIERLKEKEMR